jgi:hypothetical protein
LGERGEGLRGRRLRAAGRRGFAGGRGLWGRAEPLPMRLRARAVPAALGRKGRHLFTPQSKKANQASVR